MQISSHPGNVIKIFKDKFIEHMVRNISLIIVIIAITTRNNSIPHIYPFHMRGRRGLTESALSPDKILIWTVSASYINPHSVPESWRTLRGESSLNFVYTGSEFSTIWMISALHNEDLKIKISCQWSAVLFYKRLVGKIKNEKSWIY